MRLRKLELKDAEYMLEWMHDERVVEYLGTNFAEKTLDDCKSFILAADNTDMAMNLAIVDDQDEYLGTVSLKHIDREANTAEFAITVRKKAMGTGAASYAMKEILRLGHEKGIQKIFWCVRKDNVRAVKFYDKNHFLRTEDVPKHIKEAYSEEQNAMFYWYVN